MFKTALLITIVFLLTFCKKEVVQKEAEYDGPRLEFTNIDTKYSDSTKLKIRLTAPKELEYETGDQLFPEGLYMEFYDKETGKVTSTLRGKHGKYLKEKDIYIVTDSVVVKNLEENKKLNSDELVWNPTQKKITSDKFVRIETPSEILTGDGLISNEDFSNYQILKPKATIFLD